MIPFSEKRNAQIAEYELHKAFSNLGETLWYAQQNLSWLSTNNQDLIKTLSDVYSTLDIHSLDLDAMDSLAALVDPEFNTKDIFNVQVWRLINAWNNYRFWACHNENYALKDAL